MNKSFLPCFLTVHVFRIWFAKGTSSSHIWSFRKSFCWMFCKQILPSFLWGALPSGFIWSGVFVFRLCRGGLDNGKWHLTVLELWDRKDMFPLLSVLFSFWLLEIWSWFITELFNKSNSIMDFMSFYVYWQCCFLESWSMHAMLCLEARTRTGLLTGRVVRVCLDINLPTGEPRFWLHGMLLRFSKFWNTSDSSSLDFSIGCFALCTDL